MVANKLCEKRIYCVVTVQRGRWNMAIMPNDNEIKRGDIDF